jgi:hypothetical protein
LAPWAVPLACAGLLGLLPRGGAGVAGAVVLAVVAVPLVIVASIIVTVGLQVGLLGLLAGSHGSYRGDWTFAPIGVLAGGVLTRLALLPGVSALRRTVPEPEEEAGQPRPVAARGVPEILEWPPSRDEDQAAPAEDAMRSGR